MLVMAGPRQSGPQLKTTLDGSTEAARVSCCRNRAKASAVVLLPFLLGLSPSPVAQEESGDDLAALVRAVNRLVETLEQHAKRQQGDSDLRSIGLAVQILDIRTRQHDSLQKELRSLDDREQRSQGYLANSQSKVERLKRQISETTDDIQRAELEDERDQYLGYVENVTKQLERFTQTRADLQNRIILLERLSREVEGVVDDWLGELTSRSTNYDE